MHQARQRLRQGPKLGAGSAGGLRWPCGRLTGTPETPSAQRALARAGSSVRGRASSYEVRRRPVVSLEEALERLEAMLGTALDWRLLSDFLPAGISDADYRRSSIASNFVAALELTRLGKAEIEQADSFAPLYLRRRP